MKIPAIPFKILALAPLLGPDCPTWDKTPLRVAPEELNRVMADLGPTCTITVAPELHPDETIELKFTKLKDFHPDNLVHVNPVLRNLWEAKEWVENAGVSHFSAEKINARLANWPNLPDIRIDAVPRKPPSPSRDSLDKILDIVALPDEEADHPSGTQSAARKIAAIIQQILSQIFSDETFRTLEASWRGLNLLLKRVNVRQSDIRIEIIPASGDSLGGTLQALAAELINELPSLILVDVGFDSSPKSLEGIESVAQFSETLLVPAITWIQPAFFHIDGWQAIKRLAFLPHYLEETPFAKWQRLKMTPSARWLAVSCNRFLARYVYGKDNPPRRIPFAEQKPLWISPVWALGSLIGRSVAETGWPTHFTDWQTIRLEDLPLNTEDPQRPLPTEADFDRNRIDQLIRSGIIPLATAPGKDITFVPDETTAGGISLGYQLLVSRVTQLVLWCRDHFEKGLKGADLETQLRQAFKLFRENSGHSGPESLEIEIGKPDPDGRVAVRIALQPSRQILPSRDLVELEFSW